MAAEVFPAAASEEAEAVPGKKQSIVTTEEKRQDVQQRRSDVNIKLAQIAKEQVAKFYHGNVMGAENNLDNIAESLSDRGCTAAMLDNQWCAAFVYYCTVLAGYDIPLRYPAWTTAWEEWAKQEQNNFWIEKTQKPQPGDIVLFAQVFDGRQPDHIGIVIECSENYIMTAEGNFNNVSAIVTRGYDHILGYIRLA